MQSPWSTSMPLPTLTPEWCTPAQDTLASCRSRINPTRMEVSRPTCILSVATHKGAYPHGTLSTLTTLPSPSPHTPHPHHTLHPHHTPSILITLPPPSPTLFLTLFLHPAYNHCLFVVDSREESMNIRGFRYHPVDLETTVICSHRFVTVGIRFVMLILLCVKCFGQNVSNEVLCQLLARQ